MAIPAPDRFVAATDSPATQADDPRVEQICLMFHGFMKALHALDNPSWGSLDLTMSQLKTIMLLVDTGGLTGRDLVERLKVGAPAVTAVVDRLVQRGYARREEDRADRRISWARPTDKATALFERIHATHRARLADILKTIPADQLDTVLSAITTLEVAAVQQAGLTPRTGKACS